MITCCFYLSLLRDVSSVELLMKYHQGIMSEIDQRGPKFSECEEHGKALLARKHKDSVEVRNTRALCQFFASYLRASPFPQIFSSNVF